MKFIYRAQIYETTPRLNVQYCKPRALNWQFHAPGETYSDAPRLVRSYQKPRALNWRFKMAMEE